MTVAPLDPACAQRRCEITAKDLPLACPLPNQPVWNAHPRVYLPIEDHGGKIACPYCSTVYVLKN